MRRALTNASEQDLLNELAEARQRLQSALRETGVQRRRLKQASEALYQASIRREGKDTSRSPETAPTEPSDG